MRGEEGERSNPLNDVSSFLPQIGGVLTLPAPKGRAFKRRR